MKKLLIFSDTHLSHKFDQKKFNFLKNLIESADQVIINGDFWDNALTTFDKFIESKWNKLFPLLKERNAIYLYGNHDLPHQVDKRASLFSVKQADEYKIKIGNYKLNIQHGHLSSSITKAVYKFFKNHPKLLGLIASPFGFIFAFNEILIKKWDKRFLKVLNRANKSKIAKFLEHNEILISGHTHSPEFNLENKYINLGFIRRGFASYVVATKDGLDYVRCRY